MAFTKPEVFVIESLHQEDLKSNCVGKVITQILEMGQLSPQYRYVNTYQELVTAMNEFHQSNYRYLHLSFHGAADTFEGQFGPIPFTQLIPVVDGILTGKRVFVSSCQAVSHMNHELADILIRNHKCISLVGSYDDISFNDAALMWSTFYYLCFRGQKDKIRIKRENIVQNLKLLTKVFRLGLNYYSASKNEVVKLTQIIKGKCQKK